MAPRIILVEPRDGLSIWVEYEDGVSGLADLSDVRGMGLFRAWEDREFFERVQISATGGISWGEGDDQFDICADKVYMDVTGKSLAEVMPGFSSSAVRA